MNNRVIYVELLRIVASFSVVILHVAAGNWASVGVETFEWKVLNFYDSLVRFGVPIFVMVSGMFLLNPNKAISIKDIYYKYILRIIKAFFPWSLLYAIYVTIVNYDSFNLEVFTKSFVFGHYHLWYLFMIVGLYIITPILRKIVTDKRIIEYFLILSFIFTFCVPLIIKLFNLTDFQLFIKKFDYHFTLGYVGYFVGGYYFSSFNIDKRKRIIIYFTGVLGFICTYVLTDIVSLKTGSADGIFYSYFSPNVMIFSIAIFIFFKYEVSKIEFKKRSLKIINIMSACSFRIYLIHDFFIMFLSQAGINTLSFNPLISVLVIAIIVFIGSLITSYIIGITPILRKVF